MRYIIQLLPTAKQREHLDLIRDGLVQIVGKNRSQSYPASHITLIWSLEDIDRENTIDPKQLRERLSHFTGGGSIKLKWKILTGINQHLTLDMEEAPKLSSLRLKLFESIKSYLLQNGLSDVLIIMQQQLWPHVTLAQDINPQKHEAGMQYLLDQLALPNLINFEELALLVREEGGEYKIIETVKL